MAVPGVPKVLQDGVQMSMVDNNRQERTESKLVSFTSTLLHIRNCRAPAKIELTIHFLQIYSIESKSSDQITLVLDSSVSKLENRTLHLRASHYDGIDRPIIDEIVTHIGLSLKRYFPESELSDLIKTMDVQPDSRLTSLSEAMAAAAEKEVGPCGNFSMMYKCMCDYHRSPFRDEVVWDVDTIYLSQSCRELSLNDFDHLDGRDLVPIISSLRYNTWFTKLNATETKLIAEAMNEIIQVVRVNKVLEELHISNIGAKFDFANRLATAVMSNTDSCLQVVDMSQNSIDDRGVASLAQAFGKLSRGLIRLDLSGCSLTAKGASRLAEAMQTNQLMTSSLTKLNLSGNSLKGDEISSFCNVLAQPNAIKELNLADAELPLDLVSGALLRGCTSNLHSLNLSGNAFSIRKNTKEVIVPPSWEQFFASALYLSDIKLQNCKMPSGALTALFNGLAANCHLNSVSLDISCNELRPTGSIVLQSVLPNMVNVTTLDISDNELDLVVVMPAMASNRTITDLSIGRNFSTVKARHLAEVLDGVVQVIQDENCKITRLSVAGSKLRNETGVLINALGSNNTLEHLDISGNSMGDYGARTLAKALQINTKLQSVHCDQNGVTARGFLDIANALESNYTLRHLPAPLNDAAKVNCDPKAVQALQKIESILHRNHSPRKFNHDRSFRLQHGFLISTTQQMMDRKIGHIKKICEQLADDPESEKLLKTAKKYMKDARRSQTLMMQLKEVSLEVEEEDGAIQRKLAEIAEDLKSTVNDEQERVLEEILETSLHEVRHISKDLDLEPEIRAGCPDRRKLPRHFVKNLILEQVGADIHNKISEINLNLSAYVSDKMVDAVLDSLTSCHRLLVDALNTKISRESADEIRRARADSAMEAADDSPSEKRNSLSKRKCRPQSTIDEAATYVGKPERCREKVHQTRSSPDVVSGSGVASSASGKSRVAKLNKATMAADTVDGAASSRAAVQARLMKNDISQEISDEMLDSVSDLPGQPLQHLTKSRPRPQQRRAMATRPSARAVTSETDDGIDTFFQPASKESVVMATRVEADSSSTSSATSSPAEAPKSKKQTPTKMFSKLLGKDSDDKSSFKTSLTTGLGNFLQKKKAAMTSSGRDEVDNEKKKAPAPVEKAPEPEPEPEPEPVQEIKPKKPMGVSMMGGPMMGGNLLADLKMKQMKHVKVKTPEEEGEPEKREKSPKPTTVQLSPQAHLRPTSGLRPGSGQFGGEKPSPPLKPKPGLKPAVSPNVLRRAAGSPNSRDSTDSLDSVTSTGSVNATAHSPQLASRGETKVMTPPTRPKAATMPAQSSPSDSEPSPKPRVRSMVAGRSPTAAAALLAAKQQGSKASPTADESPAKDVAKDTESSGSGDFEMVHASDLENNNDGRTGQGQQREVKAAVTCPKATMDEDDDIIEV